jgi:hypothetical protein
VKEQDRVVTKQQQTRSNIARDQDGGGTIALVATLSPPWLPECGGHNT